MRGDVRFGIEHGFAATCVLHCGASQSDGTGVWLPKGLVIEPELESIPGTSTVRAMPVPASAWEPVFAPDMLHGNRYTSYSLVIEKPDLARCCRSSFDVVPLPGDLVRMDAFAGCLLGTAVGDALGLPFEGISPRRMSRLRALPLRHRLILGRGLLSDDTEHACINAQALAGSGGDPENFLRRLAWGLRLWLLSLPAGIGLGTLRALTKLLFGVSAKNSGVSSAGNGPLMRSPILGVFAAPEHLGALVRSSTRITHIDPRAERAALCVARAAAHNTGGNQLDAVAFLRTLHCEDDEELTELLVTIEASLDDGESTPDFAAGLGYRRGVPGSCYATLTVVLHAWLSHPLDFKRALTAVVACGGDTDTTGAILGGIVGAGVGRNGIPTAWLAGLADWPRTTDWIENLARQVAYTKLCRLRRRPVTVPFHFTLIRNIFFIVLVMAHGLRRLLPPY